MFLLSFPCVSKATASNASAAYQFRHLYVEQWSRIRFEGILQATRLDIQAVQEGAKCGQPLAERRR